MKWMAGAALLLGGGFLLPYMWPIGLAAMAAGLVLLVLDRNKDLASKPGASWRVWGWVSAVIGVIVFLYGNGAAELDINPAPWAMPCGLLLSALGVAALVRGFYLKGKQR